MRGATILLVLTLSGCGATVSHVQGSSGRDTVTLSCGGLFRSWSMCDKSAASSCPGGYDVLDRQEKKTYTDTGSFVTRKLVVACRP
jgi:hypothetical protein